MEIISGIHKIEGVRGANCYLVITETGMLVIDTGMPGNGNRIRNYIKGLGKKLSDINCVVLTHADIDHVGSAAEIKKMTSAKLAIHEDDAAVLTGKTRGKHVKGLLGLLFKLMSPLMRFHPAEPDIILKDNVDIAGFKVIHTPGHTNGSICLYQQGKIIFVGDALRSDSNGNPRPPSKTMSADVVQAKASLIAISELEFDSLLTGHGAPVVGNASTKVKNLVKDLKQNEQIPNTKTK
jgi:glyoxylase-like metal-dependent hydrolase (beta-lactamase superfamily II)